MTDTLAQQSQMRHPLSMDRQKQLLDIVRTRGAMSVVELCDHFAVSEATIRRDLTLLQRKGFLSRTHGGVVANSIVNMELPKSERIHLHEEEKLRVAEAAIELLEGNETVLLDAGTTALAIARFAHRKPDCTYITTSLGTSQSLGEQKITNHYLIGGSYLPVLDCYCGSIAISAIAALSVDVAFLCVSSIDVQRRSISIGSEAYATVQREIAAVARRNIVVADHSKFRPAAFARTASFDELDLIIAGKESGNSVLEAFSQEKLELRLV